MTSRIPHLLEPYLALPNEAALVVLTGVLGASTNWLLLRHLSALLKPASATTTNTVTTPHPSSPTAVATEGNPGANGGENQPDDVAVLLVSFLRDLPFWKDGLARLGVDLDGAMRRGRFGYVDGLTGGLFLGAGAVAETQTQSPRMGWNRVLAGATPEAVGQVLIEAVEQLRKEGGKSVRRGDWNERRVVLVVDGLDFLVAALGQQGTERNDPLSAMAMTDMLMDLRERTHAAIVTLAADDPLVKEQTTPLEKQHAWFSLNLAHEADTLCSLRLLDTGAAKDVSGVIRITRRQVELDGKDTEYLYFSGGDGAVRVFERGQ